MPVHPICDRVVGFVFPALLAVNVLLGVEASAEVRTAVIRMDDGNVYRGELVRQTKDVVVLSVQGIEATFNQEDIATLELQDTPEELYRKQRLALADQDLVGRLELAREMLDLDALRLAKFELADLDRDFPEHPAVLDMIAVVEAKQRLEQTHSDGALTAGEGPRRPERRGETEDDLFLSDREINLIKVYEIDLDIKPRLEIPDSALDSFFQKYGDHRLVPTGRRDRGLFKRLEGYEQLDLIFRVQARDLYDQVEVKQEPGPLAKFRRSVNPQYVARYFAPTFGHGEVPGLALFNKRPEDEAEAYTNFYRLSQFRVNGTPMIDRANPELSLLLQWGLARESARFPAPDVEGWRPMFQSTDDSEFQRYADWIDNLFKEDLDYGIAPAF